MGSPKNTIPFGFAHRDFPYWDASFGVSSRWNLPSRLDGSWGMQFLPISCQIPMFLDQMDNYCSFWWSLPVADAIPAISREILARGYRDQGIFLGKEPGDLIHRWLDALQLDASICHWNMGWVSHISHEQVINWKNWANFARESTKTTKDRMLWPPKALIIVLLMITRGRSKVKSGEVGHSRGGGGMVFHVLRL